MNLRDFFKLNIRKLLVSFTLFFVSLVLSLTVGISTEPRVRAVIYFPDFIYTYFHFLFTKPVASLNNCLFPGCNLVVNILTLIISIAIYYSLGALIYHFWWGKRSKYKRFNKKP